MKAKLEFNLDETHDIYAFKRASSATDAYLALSAIANEIFRPARKHGYPDVELTALLENAGGYGEEIVSRLEDKFYEILRQYKVDLGDLE